MNTNMNTKASRPLFYRVYKYELTTDKGEVGGSSPPRPTNKPNRINTFRLLIYLLS